MSKSASNSYLGTQDGRVFYLGVLSCNQLLEVGTLADYVAQAAAGF